MNLAKRSPRGLRVELENAVRERDSLRSQLKKVQASDVGRVTATNGRLHDEVGRLMQTLELMRSSLTQMSRERDQARAENHWTQYEQLETAHKHLAEKLHGSNAEIAKLTEQRNSARVRLEDLSRTLDVVQKDNRALEQRLEDAQRWRKGALALVDAVRLIGEREEVPF